MSRTGGGAPEDNPSWRRRHREKQKMTPLWIEEGFKSHTSGGKGKMTVKRLDWEGEGEVFIRRVRNLQLGRGRDTGSTSGE